MKKILLSGLLVTYLFSCDIPLKETILKDNIEVWKQDYKNNVPKQIKYILTKKDFINDKLKNTIESFILVPKEKLIF